MKTIDCPPFAPILMESTRAIGYSMEAAVADIVDNSLAANASSIRIWFFPYDEPFIAIIDNGSGMSSTKITEAMRYGSNNPSEKREENDMGRFGLGLKTASLSQCRCLTVASKENENLVARRWDLDHINSTGTWSLIELEEEEIKSLNMIQKLLEQPNGTLVLWTKLDRVISGEIAMEQALENRMTAVREHLELVFHRYISGDSVKKVAISINENGLAPFDPFFVTKSSIVMDDEKIEIPERVGKVVVKPYVLPHPSKMTKEELEKYGGKDGLRKLQGFYVYRNKRLLTWGTWFRLLRMDEFTKLARVRVDIPNSLDDLWTLDIKKSTAYPPEIVKTRLKQIIGTISNSSRKTWAFRSRKETDTSLVHIWVRTETREGIRYLINQDHPLRVLLDDQLSENSKLVLKEYIETIQNNLPMNTLHSDIQNEAKIAQDQMTVEQKRVCSMAMMLLIKAKDSGNLESTYSNFKTIEPFNVYLKEIENLYLDVKEHE